MAFWGIEIKPGKPYLHQYDDERGRLHLSQATLGSGSSKEKAVVVCNVGDKKPIYLCSLLPRKMETCSLNIEFEEYDEVTFSVEGPHSIHLSGFFYGEKPDSDGDDYESDSDEVVRIEEIVDDETPANKNAVPEQSKKKNKRTSNNDDSSQKQIVPKSSSSVPVLESEDEDGFPISSSAKDKASVPNDKQNSEVSTGKGENGQAKRKKGMNDSEHTAKRKREDSVMGDDLASQPANVEASTPEVDVKKAKKKKNKKVKDVQKGGNDSNNVVQNEEETNQEQKTPKVASEVNTDSKNKNAKKDKKSKQQENTPGEAKPSQVRTFPNGLVIEEIQMGKPAGKRADPGKKVSVRYIGKLKKNEKIFDSNIGKAPFKFRLGVGQVIAGWDVGVKGMVLKVLVRKYRQTHGWFSMLN
ncbi:Nucleoplasmin core domain-containing protein [Cynara cardunculus var. scolymus]|uniref:peptidylprolyl isomerase n=1 Tax=Cynara cardunculus var. scolymus TaxID=59895 RepID=A0A103YDP2_CYNCS|nr:Nucleoplasmin core domain-containing protein [Cynara cardunculus var. scolymus]